jgi:hypothetical protein
MCEFVENEGFRDSGLQPVINSSENIVVPENNNDSVSALY